MNLELMAMRWLRFEKRCRLAMFERSPRQAWCGQPDVLGVTDRRYLYEIEIKRSLSDFKANQRKPFHRLRTIGPSEFHDAKYPKMFWFLVPFELVDKVKPILPSWAGLLRGPTDGEIQTIWSVVKAPANNKSVPLTTKECVYLSQQMSNQILSLVENLANWRGAKFHNWRYGDYEI